MATLNLIVRACAAAFVLTFAACGGGGDDQAPTPMPPAAAPCVPLAQVRVQQFGDSTMLGYDILNGGALYSMIPTTELQARMDERFGPGVVVVQSKAATGSTSAELIAGTDRVNQAWPLPVDAHIVLVNHGVNDAKNPQTPLTNYRANLRAFAAGPWVTVFQTPNPTWGPYNDDAYAQAMREEAAALGAPVADIHAWYAARDVQALVPDEVHPSRAAYEAATRAVVVPAVGDEVARLLCK